MFQLVTAGCGIFFFIEGVTWGMFCSREDWENFRLRLSSFVETIRQKNRGGGISFSEPGRNLPDKFDLEGTNVWIAAIGSPSEMYSSYLSWNELKSWKRSYFSVGNDALRPVTASEEHGCAEDQQGQEQCNEQAVLKVQGQAGVRIRNLKYRFKQPLSSF